MIVKLANIDNFLVLKWKYYLTDVCWEAKPPSIGTDHCKNE